MYCRESEQLIARTHEVRQMFADKTYGQQVQDELKQLSLQDSFSLYQKPLDVAAICEKENEKLQQELRNLQLRHKHHDVFSTVPKFSFARPLSDSRLDDSGNESSSPTQRSYERTTSMSVSMSPGSSGQFLKRGQGKLLSWRNVANIPESMLDSSISSNVLNVHRHRPRSDISVGSIDSEQGHAGFFIGDDDKAHDESQEQFYMAIAEENEQLEKSVGSSQAEDVPPPLPPKTKKSLTNACEAVRERTRSISG